MSAECRVERVVLGCVVDIAAFGIDEWNGRTHLCGVMLDLVAGLEVHWKGARDAWSAGEGEEVAVEAKRAAIAAFVSCDE